MIHNTIPPFTACAHLYDRTKGLEERKKKLKKNQNSKETDTKRNETYLPQPVHRPYDQTEYLEKNEN